MNEKQIIGILINQRKAKKLSQQDLAEAIGLKKQSIQAYEAGRQLPPLNILVLMCHMLDCKLEIRT